MHLLCDGIYIGKNGRTFSTKCKEQMTDINFKNLFQLKRKHVYSQDHHMDWMT